MSDTVIAVRIINGTPRPVVLVADGSHYTEIFLGDDCESYEQALAKAFKRAHAK